MKSLSKLLLSFLVCLNVQAQAANMGENGNGSQDYKAVVHLDTQKVDIFHKNKLIKTFLCSSGKKPGSTPVGEFQIHSRKEKDVWKEEDGTEIDYYYISKFNKGVAFHSQVEGNHPLVREGEKLFLERKPSSMGCVRLKKEDAKWVYENLPIGVKVVVKG